MFSREVSNHFDDFPNGFRCADDAVKIVSVYATGTSADKDLLAAGVHDNATAVLNMRSGQ